MATVAPAILTGDADAYTLQVKAVTSYAKRIHIDISDGVFSPEKTVDLHELWWPDNVKADIHLMVKRPHDYIDDLVRLRPALVIVHAEAEGNFVEFASELEAVGIKVGVALLQQTSTNIIKPSLSHIAHVLIFSGNLGHYGGKADLGLLSKAEQIKELSKDIEIGWDGGVSDENTKVLVEGGVDVLAVGGFINHAPDPKEAYATLEGLVKAL